MNADIQAARERVNAARRVYLAAAEPVARPYKSTQAQHLNMLSEAEEALNRAIRDWNDALNRAVVNGEHL
jgi:hypothetical protein